MAPYGGQPSNNMIGWWASNDFTGNSGPVVAGSSLIPRPSSSRNSRTQSPSAVTTGHDHLDDYDDDNNEDLTPPPPDTPIDSPVDSPVNLPVGPSAPVQAEPQAKSNQPSEDQAGPMKQSPAAPINSLEDEIVVGTKVDKKASPRPAIPEDVSMDDVQELPAHPKRKRVSNYNELAADRSQSPAEEPQVRPRQGRPKTHGMGAVKGTTLGYWRDSPPDENKDKHSVTGFIDVRERLRTRIQAYTRDGRDITRQYPLPPGPGGSWVTFDKIAFEPHLVNLDHNQVKEYVKIRSEASHPNETLEQKARLDAQAVKQAIQNVLDNPPPETSMSVSIAYGPEIPDQVANRSIKKQRTSGPVRRSPTTTPVAQHPQPGFVHSTGPTRILLGYWKLSDQIDEADKHAVYGILGANDMFRCRLMKETRDGRPVQGNFPAGAGALWIHWDDVVFDRHLENLTRTEVKEYCRFRQLQIDAGEDAHDRTANETRAVWEGQRIAAAHRPSMHPPTPTPGPDMENTHGPLTLNGADPSMYAHNGSEMPVEGFANHGPIQSPQGSHLDTPPHESRQTRRDLGRPRHGFPPVELREANRRPPAMDPIERTHDIARREIERAEAYQSRLDQHAAEREASIGSGGPGAPPNSNRAAFQDNVHRLNKVWAAQEANRLRAGAEDAKIYGGIKYERKANGPFEGKLVSQGAIITIDGEDYVEYRVLTKPSFF